MFMFLEVKKVAMRKRQCCRRQAKFPGIPCWCLWLSLARLATAFPWLKLSLGNVVFQLNKFRGSICKKERRGGYCLGS